MRRVVYISNLKSQKAWIRDILNKQYKEIRTLEELEIARELYLDLYEYVMSSKLTEILIARIEELQDVLETIKVYLRAERFYLEKGEDVPEGISSEHERYREKWYSLIDKHSEIDLGAVVKEVSKELESTSLILSDGILTVFKLNIRAKFYVDNKLFPSIKDRGAKVFHEFNSELKDEICNLIEQYYDELDCNISLYQNYLDKIDSEVISTEKELARVKQDIKELKDKSYSVREMKRLLKERGYSRKRNGKGSHEVYADEEGNITVVSNHGTDVKNGLKHIYLKS